MAFLELGLPIARPREGASGAPVDCAFDVVNRSEQQVVRAIVACELRDERGVPVGSGLGVVENLAPGGTVSVRTVVYGVRRFASAHAVVTSADVQAR